MATEPIYRTYRGDYPLSHDFKAFSFSISLSEVGAKSEEERIRLHALTDVFYFLLKTFKVVFWNKETLDITLKYLLRSWDSKPFKKYNEPVLNAVQHSCKVKIYLRRYKAAPSKGSVTDLKE